MIGISGSLIWSKTLMELFNPYGEFQLSPEGPVSQIHSPHLHDGIPGIFSDLLRSVQTLNRSGLRKATGSYCIYSSLVKLQPWFLSSRLKTCLWADLQPWCLSFKWKTCLWAELQPWCLSIQWKTCPWAEHSDDDDMFYFLFQCYIFMLFYTLLVISIIVYYIVWLPSKRSRVWFPAIP